MTQIFKAGYGSAAAPTAQEIVPGLQIRLLRDAAVLTNTGSEVFYVRAASASFSIWTSLKHLLKSIRPALNPGYLRHHLHFGETATHATVWRDVFQLVPNAALSLTAGGCSWRFEPWSQARCGNTSFDHPAVLLKQAIPDFATPVVLELSGGTDSTAIAYALSGRHDVLAITWADPLAPGSSDVEHAKRIAGKLGFEHRVAMLSPGGLFELPAQFEPDRPSVSLFMMAERDRLVRDALDGRTDAIVVNGHGGDHIFLDPPSPVPMLDLLFHARFREALRYYRALVEFHGGGVLVPLRYRRVGRGIGPRSLSITPGKRLHRRLIRQACYENAIWSRLGPQYRLVHPFTCPAMLNYALSIAPHEHVGQGQSRRPFRMAMNDYHQTEDFSRVSKGHLTGAFQRAIQLKEDIMAALLEQGTGAKYKMYRVEDMQRALRAAALGSTEIHPQLMNALSLELFMQHWSRLSGVARWQIDS
ncbi:hypothetical protein BSR09_10995 [Stutzerimonas degradans]|nr:hypothetical protein BSR09_10995 [Stutzerimonas degradans]